MNEHSDDTSIDNNDIDNDDTSIHSFHEPTGGFKALLSQWQDAAPGVPEALRSTSAHKAVVTEGPPDKQSQKSQSDSQKQQQASSSSLVFNTSSLQFSFSFEPESPRPKDGRKSPLPPPSLQQSPSSPSPQQKSSRFILSSNNSNENLDMLTRRLNRVQARGNFEQFSRSAEFSLADSCSTANTAAKKALRQPKNLYQKTLAGNFGISQYEHSPEEEALIWKSLQHSFFFRQRSHEELTRLVASFEKCSFRKGEFIIQQNEASDHFYILQSGAVHFVVAGNHKNEWVVVDKLAKKGGSFGELSLLYTTPRAAGVQAAKNSRLFRVNQATFRAILQSHLQNEIGSKMQLLKNVKWLNTNKTKQDEEQGSGLTSHIQRLSAVLKHQEFEAGQEMEIREFWILQQGKIRLGNELLGAGDSFGERTLMNAATSGGDEGAVVESAIAETAGVAWTVDKYTFEKVLGPADSLDAKADDARLLEKCLPGANLDALQLATLAGLISAPPQKYDAKKVLYKVGSKIKPSLYFVRSGVVEVEDVTGEIRTVKAGECFGEESMRSAEARKRLVVSSRTTARVLEKASLGVLTLRDCRTVFDTDNLTVEEHPALSSEPSAASSKDGTVRRSTWLVGSKRSSTPASPKRGELPSLAPLAEALSTELEAEIAAQVPPKENEQGRRRTWIVGARQTNEPPPPAEPVTTPKTFPKEASLETMSTPNSSAQADGRARQNTSLVDSRRAAFESPIRKERMPKVDVSPQRSSLASTMRVFESSPKASGTIGPKRSHSPKTERRPSPRCDKPTSTNDTIEQLPVSPLTPNHDKPRLKSRKKSPHKSKGSKSPRSSPRRNKVPKSPKSPKSKKLSFPNDPKDFNRLLVLGEGTFGQVWLGSVAGASKKKQATPYALKIQSKHELLSEGQVGAAMREKKLMDMIKHPFIIQLLKTYQDEDFVYSVMDFVQGGELFSIMNTGEGKIPVSEDQARFYGLGIADALAYMHRLNIAYRDLKPENVMIDETGYPVLIDFGFAKICPETT